MSELHLTYRSKTSIFSLTLSNPTSCETSLICVILHTYLANCNSKTSDIVHPAYLACRMLVLTFTKV